MQNKSAIWVFTVLLILACVFQISFTWVVSGVEKDARKEALLKLDSLNQVEELTLFQQDSARQSFENLILIAKGPEKVYPVLGYNYNYCKKRELNLGLDLQGGMHVTLEVSIPDMISSMAASNKNTTAFLNIMDKARELNKNSTDDFISSFEKAHTLIDPNFALASIFHNLENKERIAHNASNAEIISLMRTEAEEAIQRTEQVLRKRVDNLGVVQPKIQRLSGTGRIVVELPGVKDKARVRKILQGTARLEFFDAYQNYEIYPAFEQINALLAATLKDDVKENTEATSDSLELVSDEPNANEVIEIDSNLVDADSIKEESLEDLLGNTDELSDTTDLSREELIKRNPLFAVLQPQEVGSQPVVGIAVDSDTAKINAFLNRKDARRILPPRVQFMWDAKPIENTENVYALYAIRIPKNLQAPIEGDVVSDASVSADPFGNPTVSMSMNAKGTKVWREMTRQASSNSEDLKSVAVVLDGLVYSCPRVQGEIPSGRTEITGRFTQQEASDLAGVLKAGKLPAPSHIIEEAIVGPSLGEDSINSGTNSFIIALALVLLYMIFYYAQAGIVANVALISNVFFIMGVLASLRATLTLPGIAGIVLTIGMSVDANVLIYERIREELRAGKGQKLAVSDGYKNAYSSILDANITTLLTGIILATFGTGPIQGFATTLIIGILTSLFSAIFITRLLFEYFIESSKKPISFSIPLTQNVLQNTSFNFLSKSKTFYVVSGILIIISLGSLATKGLNFGVDFTGGRSYIVRFDQTVNVNELSQSLGELFIEENGVKQVPEVKTFGAANQVKITTKFLIDSDNNEDAERIIESKLFEGLEKYYVNDITYNSFLAELSSQKVEPTIANDIKQSAIWSVLFSLIVIFLYILIRFRRWQFSVGAIVAMTHDVIIVMGLFSIFYGLMPFSLEIDQAFIAAILTVVGYSINDTVVVFDRIREELGLHPKRDMDSNVNSAINSTLSRTINTSLTTLLVLSIIFIFGGEVIRGFIFALVIGVIVGTYSSIFIASPISTDLLKKADKAIK